MNRSLKSLDLNTSLGPCKVLWPTGNWWTVWIFYVLWSLYYFCQLLWKDTIVTIIFYNILRNATINYDIIDTWTPQLYIYIYIIIYIYIYIYIYIPLYKLITESSWPDHGWWLLISPYGAGTFVCQITYRPRNMHRNLLVGQCVSPDDL